MMTPVCRIMAALLAATLFTLSEAQARTYRYTSFDVPGATINTAAFGINNAGTIAGLYYQNGYHGFIRTPGGSYTTIDVDGGPDTFIFGINASGRIVGGYGNAEDYTSVHGFIYDNGTYTFPFDVPGSFGSWPAGINRTGQIIGQYSQNGTMQGVRGFLWSGDNFTTLADPAYEPRGINDAGWIVGSYGDANSINHGFIRSPGGVFSTFDVPGATHTLISGINNHNWISGWYRHNDDICHGFVYDGRAFSYIDVVAGSIDVQVWGINDLGEVVGACSDHGFIAKPVRDISGLLLLLLGD
jgi:hypothetical protein